ncbi:phenylalanine 4-monooxygenase [Flavobacterium sp. MAHUQ-51]|uniref:phenylalanine 4-monooxygenase n=1 Tax=Flavobacterium sp. GCM10022190 TaxID=3252639 RepID=UPI003610695A
MDQLKQIYEAYTEEEHKVWKLLFDRQVQNLKDKACDEYLKGLEVLKPALNAERIPDFSELNPLLKAQSGWTIEVVPGLIEVDAFFELLSQKKFPSSTWLRKREQLDYLEEPDMFHDIFGHIPQLVHADYSNFMQKFGEIGYKYHYDKEKVIQLQRLYWFTIEFGLIDTAAGLRIYGAGITSSVKETQHVFAKDITVAPYDKKRIMDTDYIISDIQNLYFKITSFGDLFESLLLD